MQVGLILQGETLDRIRILGDEWMPFAGIEVGRPGVGGEGVPVISTAKTPAVAHAIYITRGMADRESTETWCQ